MQSYTKKRIIVSVTSDLVSDKRVHRICTSLTNMGFDVLLVGRKLPGSPTLDLRNYSTKRFGLLFYKGPFFYAGFNLKLLFFLLFSKFDLLLSNDLDTLPANFFASKIKRKPLVYDSHEFFTESPELLLRPRVKRIWEWIEKKMVPKLKHAYTVSSSIAKIYSDKYNVPFCVIRNVPVSLNPKTQEDRQNIVTEQIILYQGAVNIGRGLEYAIRAMKFLEEAKLVIAGDGDIKPELEKLTIAEGLQDKVKFIGRLPFKELAHVTSQAAIGLSIEEDMGLNYHFSLPNKLFDYIQAQVPVLVTDLPEMAAVVKKYKIGEIISTLEPRALSKIISEMLNDNVKRDTWGKNLKMAAAELNWEQEEKKLKKIFGPFIIKKRNKQFHVKK